MTDGDLIPEMNETEEDVFLEKHCMSMRSFFASVHGQQLEHSPPMPNPSIERGGQGLTPLAPHVKR